MPLEKADLDAVKSLIADAIKPISEGITPLANEVKDLAANQKVIADTMAADAAKAADVAKPKTTDPAGAAAAPVTADAVAKMVSDAIATAEKQRQQAQQASADREAYVQAKLKDLPAIYQAKLGNDPAKWPAEEQTIRASAQADFKAMGGSVKDVPGSAGAGATPSGAASAEKITQFKASGLSDGEAQFAASQVIPA
jgi:hypothetical protein